MAAIADRLIKLRKDKGATQKEVADYLGIAERNYRRYEISDADPSTANLSKLADYFGVTTDYIICRTDYWLDADGNRQPNEQDKSISES